LNELFRVEALLLNSFQACVSQLKSKPLEHLTTRLPSSLLEVLKLKNWKKRAFEQ